MRWGMVVALLVAAEARAQEWRDWLPPIPRSERGRQGDAAKKMIPEALRLRPPSASDRAPVTIRVRAWAAADYRRQTADWQARFRRILERVDGATRGWPGVRFELAETREWDRESSERSMGALVDELCRMDPGADGELVVGLVAAMPVFPGAIDNIGMARFRSRCMVMRALHDLAEYDYLRGAFDALTAGERDAIMSKRKVHKEQVIFLHEWAHTLGLVHAKRFQSIMNPSYDSAMRGFSDEEAGVIERVLARAGDDEVRAFVEKRQDPDWEPRDRQLLMTLFGARPPPPKRVPPPPRPLDDKDRAMLGEAIELERAGSFQAAWDRVARLESKRPRDAELRLLECRLAFRRPQDAARASIIELACGAAAQLAPAAPEPILFLADAHLRAGERDRAGADLDRAEKLLDGAGELSLDGWRTLALLQMAADRPAEALRASAHADHETAVTVAEWASGRRR
jgi:hypothetical protein